MPSRRASQKQALLGSNDGKTSGRIHSTEDARRLARRRVPRIMFDFVDGSAGSEMGERLNRATISQIRLQPRVLVNVEGRSLDTHFLGLDMGLPFGVAPMGMCNLTWPGTDRMLAVESARRRIPLCVSSAASTSLEDMQILANGRAWFQLYVGSSVDSAMRLVDRAAASNYDVLILTVDVPQVARRIRDLHNGFKVPFRIGPKQFLDFVRHPHWSVATLIHGAPRPRNFEAAGNGKGFVRDEGRGAIDWAFLDRLRRHWRGKLVVKGVTSPDDAVRIREAGADAVYVSNHGGRQLDSAPPAIQMLPQIRAALGDSYPLIFDSGLRSGEDVVKALALGANFVMLGRPLLYAIGADGARGLTTLLDILAEDISVTLAQIGRRRIVDVDDSVLVCPPRATRDTAHRGAAPEHAIDVLEV